MINGTIMIAEASREIRDQIKRVISDVRSDITIVETVDGPGALKKMPQTSATVLFANLDLPGREVFLDSIEDPKCPFARPLNYYFYNDSSTASHRLPQVNNLTVAQLPLSDSDVQNYLQTIFEPEQQQTSSSPSKSEVKKEYMKVPIEVVLKFGNTFPFDVFLKMSSKIIKLSQADEDRQEQFERYHSKGLECVFVVKEDYISYLKSLQKSVKSRFINPSSFNPTEDSLVTLDSCYKAVKASFEDKYVPPETISLAKDVAENSLKTIEQAANIFEYFKSFKEKCDQQFLVTNMTSFLMTFILERFDWASKVIKDKMALAAMLCDISLDAKDIKEIKRRKDNPKKLSQKVLDHPVRTAEMLRPNLKELSNDILNIIVQHHEKPDGSGYPYGLKHQQINTLSAIFIVAYDFVTKLVDSDFEHSKILPILNELAVTYNSGNFRKAYKALREVFN